MFKRKSSEEKMMEEKRNVARLIVQIEEVVDIFRQTSADCLEGAYEAAKLGRDDYAKDLVETSAEIDGFVEDLEFVALKLKQTAITADAMSKLGNLDSALSSCKKLFQNAPDFKSIGKKMGDLTSSMHSARDSFRDFRQSLSSNDSKDAAYEAVFGKKREAKDPKHDKRVSDKMKAIEAKLAMDGTVSAVATAPKIADVETPAGMSDLAQMLGDESGKQ